MLRLFLTSLIWVAVQTVFAQQPVFLESFKPDERVHDFGVIKEKDGPVSHTFTITNNGKSPVSVTEVNAWCGCTTAEFSKKPVRSGKKTRLTVTFNPLNRPGQFSKEVVVILDDGKRYIRLWVKGKVEGYQHPVTEDYPYAYGEGLYMTNKILPFPHLKAGQNAEMSFGIANDTDKPMTVKFSRQPNNTVLKMPSEIVLKAREHRTVRVSYTAVKERAYDCYILIYPVVNGHPVKPLRVTWFGR